MFQRRTTTMAEYDVIVVGAGIIGSCAAYHLAKQGKNVLLLEQFPLPHIRGSSHGQSRIKHYYHDDLHCAEMMKEAHEMWREIEREAATTLMHPCQFLRFGELEKSAEVLRKTDFLNVRFPPRELQQRYPMINFETSHSGVLDKEAHILFANRCVSTIQGLFLQFGGTLQDREKVTKIEPGPVVQVVTNRGQYRAKSIILATGPWASGLLSSLGLELPIKVIGVTVGYWRQKNAGNTFSIGNFPSFGATHGGSDENGQPLRMYGHPAFEYPEHVKIGFRGGQLIDPDRRDAHPEDTHDIEAMKVFVRSHFPGLEDFPSITERCIISLTPDEESIIDQHPTWKNIIFGVGFSGHGFEIAPAVGRILGQLASGVKPQMDMSTFRMDRFNVKAKL